VRAVPAASGAEAIELLAASAADGCERFDVMLLDLTMPEMDGIAVVQRARSDPRTSGVPIVMMASLGSKDRREAASRAGVDGHLLKPVRRRSLLDAIAKAVGGKRPSALDRADARPGEERESRRAGAFRVLVVEDNETNGILVSRFLERFGYAADVVPSGRAAIEAVSTTAYDAVLMDWHMPGMNGLEAAAAIRSLGGAAAAVPIIALTANAIDGDRERCIAAGMDDYLAKPFRPDDLKRLVDRWARRGRDESPGPPAPAAGVS
jgi:CheY-like chemotaxis protein